MPQAIHTPSGGGDVNHAFGLERRFHVAGDGAIPSVFEENVPEGAGPPRHIHHKAAELFVVRSGRVLFEADGQQIEASAGDTLLVPPGAVHAFKGIAPEGSVVLITLTPGGGDMFFRRVEAEGLSPQSDMPRIIQLAAETDLEFVGPPL